MACGISSSSSSLPMEDVATFIFKQLDDFDCKGTLGIVSEEEEAQIEGEPLVIYDRLGPKALKYMEYCESLRSLRLIIPSIISEKRIENPNLVCAITLVKKGLGLCGEQSTYVSGKISTVFEGATAQIVVSNPINPRKNHAFCLIAEDQERLIEQLKVMRNAQVRGKEFHLRDLSTFTRTYFVDPLFREAMPTLEIAGAMKTKKYLENNGATKISAIQVVPSALKPLFEKSEESATEVLAALESFPLDESRALKEMRSIHELALMEQENKSLIQFRFSDLTWIKSGRMLIAQGTKEMLDRLEREVSKTFEIFRGTYQENKDFALVCLMP